MKKKTAKKKIPAFKTDAQAEQFLAEADLTEYDLSGATPTRFEFEKKDSRINMRLPDSLLSAVKAKAEARGIPYQRLIREVLEKEVSRS